MKKKRKKHIYRNVWLALFKSPIIGPMVHTRGFFPPIKNHLEIGKPHSRGFFSPYFSFCFI